MEENTHIIDLEELKSTVTKIDKKIILVNSSKYTDEAFEYLLDLIDENETIAFIIDERQIYTHGEYFGGDLWEDSLNYFSKYVLLDDKNEIKQQLYANNPKEAMQLKGEGGVDLYADYDIERDANTIHIKYNLENAIDKSSLIKINNDYISLTNHDDKIALDYYDGVNISLSEPKMLEYDNGNTEVYVYMDIQNSEKLRKLNITASGNGVPLYNIETKNISLLVFNNVKTILYVDYEDDYAKNTKSVTQDWGYAFAYGNDTIAANNFNLFKCSDFENEFHEKTININIEEGNYGWFAYPANVEISFIDTENGLVGGWKKHSTFTRYENEILYQVYRTEQSGLGNTTWKIVKK